MLRFFSEGHRAKNKIKPIVSMMDLNCYQLISWSLYRINEKNLNKIYFLLGISIIFKLFFLEDLFGSSVIGTLLYWIIYKYITCSVFGWPDRNTHEMLREFRKT